MKRRTRQVVAGLGLIGTVTLAASDPGCTKIVDKDPCPAQVITVNNPELPLWPTSDGSANTHRNESLITVSPGRYVKYRSTSYPAESGCWEGGTISTAFEPQDTPWRTWHDTGAFIINTPQIRVRDALFRNVGDGIGIDPNGQDWRIDSVEAAQVHDDFAQNDWGRSGVISNSLISAWSFLSSRGAAMNGAGESVLVEDTMVRLWPYRNSYEAETRGENKTGGFFKWATTADQGTPPLLTLRNVTLRADQPGTVGGTWYDFNGNGRPDDGENVVLGLPPGTVCEGTTTLIGDGFDARTLRGWKDACPKLEVLTGDAGRDRWDELEAEWRSG